MGSNWPLVKLGDFVDIKTGNPFKSKNYSENYGVRLLRGDNIVQGSFRWANVKFWPTELIGEKENGYFLSEGDVILAMDRPWIEAGLKTAQINESDLPCLLVQRVACIRAKQVDDQDFLRYLISSYWFVQYVKLIQTGTAVPHVSPKQIKDFEFRKPPQTDRILIGQIMKSLDSKIHLNTQTNQTLEQMAQTLFKSWFVDFDPVFDNMLAKVDFKLDTSPSKCSSDLGSKLGCDFPDVLLKKAKKRLQALQDRALQQGCDLHALLAGDKNNIHSHFPSEFEFSEQLGWIPKGWESIAVNEMVNTVSDTYPLKTVDKVVFLNTGDILDGKFLHQNYSDTQGLPGQAKKSIKKGDILYSEIRPKNKRFALVNFDGAEHVVSTKLMVLRPNKGFEALFPYFVLTQDKNITILQRAAESRSGTFPQITYTELSMIRVALPEDKKIVELFIETHLKNHFARKDQLDFQNETLTKLRDTLLPKLISGELQIPDVVPA